MQRTIATYLCICYIGEEMGMTPLSSFADIIMRYRNIERSSYLTYDYTTIE